jgi:putative transposase
VYPAKGEPMVPFTHRQTLYPGKKINIPSLGLFRLKQPIPFLCSSQTFTLTRIADRWFVSFALDVDKLPPVIHPIQSVGIDLGVKCFATLSDGSKIVAPPSLKSAKTKLSKDMWRNRNKLSGNRTQGVKASKNALKYYQKLARRHARIAKVQALSRKQLEELIEDLLDVSKIEDLE